MVRIIEVDPRDEAGLRAFHDTEQAAIRHDRPDAVIRTWPALLTLAQTPSPYYRRTFLAAVDDGRTVGVADLGGSVRDNEHLADLEINVLADHRRRGLGRALWEEADRPRRADGRTSVCGEVCLPAGVTPDTSPAYAFAEAMGFSTVHREDQLVLRLPVDMGYVAVVSAAVEGRAASYEIVTWRNRCPEEYVAAFCEMKTTMSTDVPIGEIDYQPIVYEPAAEGPGGAGDSVVRPADRGGARARHRESGGLQPALPAARRGLRHPGRHPGHAEPPRSPPRRSPQAHHPGDPPAGQPGTIANPHLDRSGEPRDVPHQHRAGLPGGRANARDAAKGRLKPCTPT